MYLDIVLIDVLTPAGILTSYKVRPKYHPRGVVVDRLRDIYPERFSDDGLDIGGTRIYNASTCSIEKMSAHIRAFEVKEADCSFSFQFEHMGIPIGPSREAHGGIYNSVLSPGWRLREIWIVDPYDHKHPSVKSKKQFRYQVIWDTQCKTQMVEMEMRSGRGSFSFIVAGIASLVATDPGTVKYVEASESEWGISRLSDTHLLDEKGKKRLAEELAEKANWLELKPNIFGLGINLNKIIRDSIHYFQRKMRTK
jgi:hypothetical protein